MTQLGFKGAIIHGLTRGAFPDERPFWPVLEAAHRLDFPIYIHPATPHPAVIGAYYKGFPSMVRVGHGFTAETAAIATRLALSEVFDAFPRLQIILGHLGEALPFSAAAHRSLRVATHEGAADLRRNAAPEFLFHHQRRIPAQRPAMHDQRRSGSTGRCSRSTGRLTSNAERRALIDSAPIDADAKALIFEGNARRLLRL